MSWPRAWAQLTSNQCVGSWNKTFPGTCAAQHSTGMGLLIPLGPWIHRNERQRRRWTSSFLLFPRNKAEEVKECSKHKRLWIEHLLCSGGAETNLGYTSKERDPALPAAGASPAAEPIWRMWSRFWHHHKLSSTGFSMWHCQTAVSWEQPFPSTRKNSWEFAEDASTAEILSWRDLLNIFSWKNRGKKTPTK